MPVPPDYFGHRKRLKERYLRAGESGLSDHELLELLLCYAIPRKDVKPLAKELLRRFNSLRGVLMAETGELTQVKGISLHTAILLQLGRGIFVRCLQQDLDQGTLLDTDLALTLYLRMQCGFSRKEQLCLLLLNKKCQLIDKITFTGQRDMILCDPHEILRCILFHRGVAAVVLAHNHPQNSEIPSKNDIITTKRLQILLKELGITLKDHFIVTRDKCISIMNSELYLRGECRNF